MKKSELLRALQTEIRRHNLDTFTVDAGGQDVVTPGCPTCKKRLFTIANLMDHICEDVLPPLLDKLYTAPDNQGVVPRIDPSIQPVSLMRSVIPD